MLRTVALLSVVIVVVFGSAAAATHPGAVAQEATPAGNGMEAAGVAFEPLGFAPGVTAPAPTDLVLVRLAIDPGAVLPLEPSDPDGGLLYLEAGELTLRADVPLTVHRAGALAAAFATAEAGAGFAEPGEAVAPGQDVTVGAGDAVFVPGGIGGEVRNDGAERAEGLIFLLTASEQMGEPATPAP